MIHTYIPLTIYLQRDAFAMSSQIFFRDTQVLPKLLSYEEYYRRDRWEAHHRLIVVYLVDINDRLAEACKEWKRRYKYYS
jgi:hypothetical protein